jgi:hypothetical protein
LQLQHSSRKLLFTEIPGQNKMITASGSQQSMSYFKYSHSFPTLMIERTALSSCSTVSLSSETSGKK